MTMVKRWKELSKKLALETTALALAAIDPRTPWYAKAWTVLVVAYAFSPIDLIPDFIPVLGYLDDLLLIPAGIALALKMIPALVMAEAREKARQGMESESNLKRLGVILIILVWLGVLTLVVLLVWKNLR